MNIKPVLYVVGLFLMLLGVVMVIPGTYDLIAEEGGGAGFFQAAIVTFVCGGVCSMSTRFTLFRLDPRQIFLLTTICWMAVSAFGALPFMFVEDMSFTDSFFETMSGITTTGSTVIAGLDQVDRGILLWRSLLQWLGGIGFIVMAVAILPFLKVGGMRLFQSESSDWSDKIMPRSGSIAKRIVGTYLALTLLCALGYWIGDMTWFDAINHSMTTLSTGGYSTWDASIGHFKSYWVYWNGTVFMLLGSMPFVLFVKFARGHTTDLFEDSQVQTLVGFMVALWVVMALWLTFEKDWQFFHALTLVAFNTASVVSTTGFALTDYATWSLFTTVIFFFLMFVGGCSGSTAGGMKIFRFQIGFKLLQLQLKQASHPRAFLVQRYNGQEITNDILRSLVAFSFFYGLLIALITMLLSALGLDLITSMTGAITAVSNVGPGLGSIIGPAGNFIPLPDAAKWILSVGMLMGRLEILTVLVLMTPSFWRN
ncbi:TrkH family potassium uptake protein [Parendozoicomonas haliclonae]|uniref:Trk system potassium uptake protein n=1 Tax=Parendozoicomonas haliclonae TaxID=1960125 RepID=A0A1X7AKV0_9GAMM|nr:TrkH family potassium uptake protein [Parendozoicomonas haliclonae]SMA47445.1 Trk system potassium uptake protein TrkH [Parendozoicomonas haliclonae]